jgi:hypothetical protein
MSGELSRNMNVIYGRTKRLIREENRNFQNKGDLLRILPEVILLIEQLFKTLEGKNKRLLCLGALEMAINNMVEDEAIKESLHEFLRSDIPEIINNMVYLGNIGVKYFKQNRNCCLATPQSSALFVKKLKNKDV